MIKTYTSYIFISKVNLKCEPTAYLLKKCILLFSWFILKCCYYCPYLSKTHICDPEMCTENGPYKIIIAS